MKKQKNNKRVGRSARTRQNHCLNCEMLIDGATGVDHRNKPHPGAITICIYCGHMMAFAKDMTLRELTEEEIYDLAGDKTVLDIQHARGMVMNKRDQR